MKKKFSDRAKKAGWRSFISRVPGGVEADAVLRGVTDTENRDGWDPLYEFEMEVIPEDGEPFLTHFKGVVPAGLVPNFQLGRTFRVVYDPGDRSRVSFISFAGEENEPVDLRRFPLKSKNVEYDQMEPE